jgi:hypothetical protein
VAWLDAVVNDRELIDGMHRPLLICLVVHPLDDDREEGQVALDLTAVTKALAGSN